jgi:DNA-binding MarR family transcriptional regulator
MREVTMASTILDQLIGVTPQELELLRKVNEIGAVSVDELAIKLKRAGDDLAPEIDDLVQRNLLKVRTLNHDGEKTLIYLTAHDVRPLL